MNVDLQKRPELVTKWPCLKEAITNSQLKQIYVNGQSFYFWETSPANLPETGVIKLVMTVVQNYGHSGGDLGRFRLYRIRINPGPGGQVYFNPGNEGEKDVLEMEFYGPPHPQLFGGNFVQWLKNQVN